MIFALSVAIGLSPIGNSDGEPELEHDEALVSRCRQGDRTAFNQLYRRHAARLHRLLTRLVGREEAEDILQQTFLEAFRSLDKFRGESAFSTWLYRVATNTAMNAMRRRRRRSMPTTDVDFCNLEDSGEGSPESLALRRELLTRVTACLNRLKPKHRIAFVLRYGEDLSLEEVASVVGSNGATVGKRVRKAEREIVRLLAAEDHCVRWKAGTHEC